MNTNEPDNQASLSENERALMKREFMAYLDANPRAGKSIPARMLSPYFVTFVHAPAFALVSLLVVATGTAYAAESSLPNDFLYPLKTGLIEPVFISAPALTRASQARATTSLIERRLDEAHELLARDEMDGATANDIREQVTRHATSVRALIAESSASGEVEEALETSGDLENTLEAHEALLEVASDEREDADESIHSLIESVESEADGAEQASDKVEKDAIESIDEDTVDYLRDAERELASGLASLKEEIQRAEDADELTESVRDLLADAEKAHEEGAKLLAEDNGAKALPELRDAMQGVEQARIILESRDEVDEG